MTSRPCAVSAQITAMSIAMIAIADTGAKGSHANAASALTDEEFAAANAKILGI